MKGKEHVVHMTPGTVTCTSKPCENIEKRKIKLCNYRTLTVTVGREADTTAQFVT